MAHSPEDLLFVQHLYGQDTLYLVPEAPAMENQPLPAQAAVINLNTIPAPAQVPNQPEGKAPVDTKREPETAAVPETALEPPKTLQNQDGITWLGEAVKGTYLLFYVPQAEFITLPQHLFLQKVLTAVGLASLEVKFGNLAADKTHNIKQIAQAHNARHILVFGDDVPVENLLKLDLYRMYKLDETRFVRVNSLAEIENDNALKAKLWDVLKKIFLQ